MTAPELPTWFTKALGQPVVAGRPVVTGEAVLRFRWRCRGHRRLYDAAFKPALLPDGSVFLTTSTISNTRSTTVARWLKDGKPVAEQKLANAVSPSSPAVLPDGTVVLAAGSGHLYWLHDGALVATLHVTSSPLASPALLADGTVVTGSSEQGGVHWLADGRERFRHSLGSPLQSSPAILSDDTVVISSLAGTVFWLRDGARVARFQTGGEIHASGAVLPDDTVVIGSDDGVVYWLKEGAEVHRFSTGAPVRGSAACLPGGGVVVTGADGVHWLRDGNEQFRFGSGAFHGATPAVYADGTVVLPGSDSHVYWLRDGVVVARYRGVIGAHCVSLTEDGTVLLDDGEALYWLSAAGHAGATKKYPSPKSACQRLSVELLDPSLLASCIDVRATGKQVTAVLMCSCPEDLLEDLIATSSFQRVLQLYRDEFAAAYPRHTLELEYDCSPIATRTSFAVVLRHNGELAKLAELGLE